MGNVLSLSTTDHSKLDNESFSYRGPRENRENGQKNPCQGKHREFGNFAKTQGISFAQVVNSLILKV